MKKDERKSLEKCFQDINRTYVRIRKENKIMNNQILFKALNQLINTMKSKNGLFRNMKPKLEFLGSYFDGVRVKHPSEYDINLILTIPINYCKVSLEAAESQNGYTFVIMPSEFRRLSKTPQTTMKGFINTILWCDKNHRLSVKRFRSWIQSVIDIALGHLHDVNEYGFQENRNAFQIQHRLSGPANTLTLKNNDHVIDIDLVPSLSFMLPKIPNNSKIDLDKISATKINQYFVVPKPSNDDYSWRLAFPFQERFYIYNKYNLKSTLKIIKLLRDTQNLKTLSSYYIKTVFLWESFRTDENFWKSNALEFLVLHMLKRLNECLFTGKIANFWCKEHNLLENIKKETCKTWFNKLSIVINNIDRNKFVNPEIVYIYFTKENKNKQKCIQ
ncbi:uncharacterized protein LOC114247162 [Bombyx mandarina]|uniref:Cyclic GMP-AMP synthase n=2 Tax=Bombyx TaxID=7090 RepID=A0A8R2DL85_BOMMO|nr:uncharacterized protein LOC101736938 [Bombyx mori]XP_021205173.2 uncharacterized protein LOC101736938 [Bombyx mori]XP_021205174.2 uncharacterized protein LOC101736938 [Bombyx mori]XP_021205176.2 uncharacterized protein LOC101736938 [Bombyx mori]XP_021205177.2 uncharacterized protein LOC101736938 [Bombyx mori]XP_028035834.1 uncharacterized protein LOC114247162 [Bombyx mandarina]XP_028035835.1 uncharacterized protein LOC114247162 [Bombyx mandarina]